MGGTVNVAPKVSISTYWIHCRTRLHMWKSWGYFTIYGGSLVGLHTASTDQLPGLGCYFYSTIRAALDRKKLISWSHYAGTIPWSHYAGTLVPWSHYAGTVPWSHYAGTLITALPRHLILVYRSALDTFMVLCSVYCMYQPWRILLQYCLRSSRQKEGRTLVTATKIYCSICSVPCFTSTRHGWWWQWPSQDITLLEERKQWSHLWCTSWVRITSVCISCRHGFIK